MHNALIHIASVDTARWQIIGILGTMLFSGRWILQIWQSHKAGKPLTTKHFWYISIGGSICLLAYFTFGNRDIVGIVSNLFPMLVAGYNLRLLMRKPSADSKIG